MTTTTPIHLSAPAPRGTTRPAAHSATGFASVLLPDGGAVRQIASASMSGPLRAVSAGETVLPRGTADAASEDRVARFANADGSLPRLGIDGATTGSHAADSELVASDSGRAGELEDQPPRSDAPAIVQPESTTSNAAPQGRRQVR